jgi:hypothetical protein
LADSLCRAERLERNVQDMRGAAVNKAIASAVRVTARLLGKRDEDIGVDDVVASGAWRDLMRVHGLSPSVDLIMECGTRYKTMLDLKAAVPSILYSRLFGVSNMCGEHTFNAQCRSRRRCLCSTCMTELSTVSDHMFGEQTNAQRRNRPRRLYLTCMTESSTSYWHAGCGRQGQRRLRVG